MTVELCFLLNIVLLSRLVFTFQDTPLSRQQTLFMAGVQLAGLFFYRLTPLWFGLLAVLAAVLALFYYFEHRVKKVNEVRLLALLVTVLALTVFMAPWAGMGFSPWLSRLAQALAQVSLLFAAWSAVDWLPANIIALGLLLATNEANLFIRFLFQVLDLVPRKGVETDRRTVLPVDKREYNAGRVIGFLERILIFFFVLNGQYTAIGITLAAKSFTRFKELENREFAEYILIGTLLSTLLAILIAVLIKSLG